MRMAIDVRHPELGGCIGVLGRRADLRDAAIRNDIDVWEAKPNV